MQGSDLGQVVQRGLAKNKKYDAVEMKPLSSADDEDDTEKKSKADEWLEYAWRKLHALLWIIIAGALATYLDIVEVVMNGHPVEKPDRQLHRCAHPHCARSHSYAHQGLCESGCACQSCSNDIPCLVSRFSFNIGLAGFGGWVCMAIYLVIWLKYILKVDVEWEEYAPRAIPIATACAVGSLVA